MKNKKKMIDSSVMTKDIFFYNQINLPKIFFKKEDLKENRKYIFLKFPNDIKKPSFITQLITESNSIHNKNCFSQELIKNKLLFNTKNHFNYFSINDNSKKELKKLNLRTLSNDLDYENYKTSIEKFPTFRSMTLNSERQLNTKKNEKMKKYVNNFREFFLNKQNKNLILKPHKKYILHSKNKILGKIKDKSNSYLKYLSDNNIINIKKENINKIETEDKINKLFQKMKKETREEIDKVKIEFEI